MATTETETAARELSPQDGVLLAMQAVLWVCASGVTMAGTAFKAVLAGSSALSAYLSGGLLPPRDLDVLVEGEARTRTCGDPERLMPTGAVSARVDCKGRFVSLFIGVMCVCVWAWCGTVQAPLAAW
jgi:hypothetical protein